jgi:hypothetical protein
LLTLDAFKGNIIQIIIDIIKQNIETCISENQKLFFGKRGEYSMVINKNRRENTFLEFIREKNIIKRFFGFLEEKHIVLFDTLVERLSIVLSR